MADKELQNYADELAEFYGIEKETEYSKHLTLLSKIDLTKDIGLVYNEANQLVLSFLTRFPIDSVLCKLINSGTHSPFGVATDSGIEVSFKIGQSPYLATDEMTIGFVSVLKDNIIKDAIADLGVIRDYQKLKKQ